MSERIQALMELERRGSLPEKYAPLLAEARRRGLVPDGSPTKPSGLQTSGEEVANLPPHISSELDRFSQEGNPQKPITQVLSENLLGDNDPDTLNTGERIGSFLNKAGESMTMGLVGDEASAAVETLGGLAGDYDARRDHYRDQEALLERDYPGASLIADIGGAVAAPVGAIGALPRGSGILKRMGASGAATGGFSGVYGFTEGEGGAQSRLGEAGNAAAIGGGIGSLIPLAGSAVQKVGNTVARNRMVRELTKNAPTSDQLRVAGREAYQQVDDAGLSIRPDRVSSVMGDISDALRGEGAAYTGAETVLPASRGIMNAANDVAQGQNTVPLRELDIFRRYAGNAAASNLKNAGDTRAATRAVEQVDDFVRNLGPDDIDAGDIETVQSLLPKARDIWARMSRSQMLDDAIENSANYRSGQANGLRAQFQRIVNNDRLRRGFSDAEVKMMRRVVNGSVPEQILNYLGSGLGMMGQMAVGGLMSGGLGGVVVGGLTGGLSRKASEAITSKNAEIVRALVAAGGLKQLPQASPRAAGVIEQLLRQGTAATRQPQ